jgi:hypothetical protein
VAERKPFLLRIDTALLEALQRWANDDLRSLNGQIEFLLRESLRASSRLKPQSSEGSDRRENHQEDTGGHPNG